MANKIEKTTQEFQEQEKRIQKGRFINQCMCDHKKGTDVAVSIISKTVIDKETGREKQIKVARCKLCRKEFSISAPAAEAVDTAIGVLDTVLDLAKIMCPQKDDKAKEKFSKCQLSLKTIAQAYEFSVKSSEQKKQQSGSSGAGYSQRGLVSDIYQRAYTPRDDD